MKILIDNGHGENTAGQTLLLMGNYENTFMHCEIAESVERALRAKGYDVERIVHETVDVPLAERARRVNEICARYGATNVLLVSIHCNAAGNGEWMSARGWSAYTSKGKTKSDELATMLYEEAEQNFAGQKIRRDNSDGDPDWEENFYILVKTKCPAVLTENFFQDNKEDVNTYIPIRGSKPSLKRM